MKSALFSILAFAMASFISIAAFGQNTQCLFQPVVFAQEDCSVAILPSMVLADGWQDFEAGSFEISIIDNTPADGNIVTGVGEFVFEVRCIADTCYEFQDCWGFVQVIDTLPPEVVCDTNLEVFIPPHEQSTRVFFDEFTTYTDNCSNGNTWEIVRNKYDPINQSCGDNLSPANDFVDFFCCDIGQAITIEVRVGNASAFDSCQITVTPQQSPLESCSNMQDTVAVSYLDFPNDFDPANPIHLDLFTEGISGITDNCNTYVEEAPPTLTDSDCGLGLIIRNFILYQEENDSLIGTCHQYIKIDYPQNYVIKFPTDYTLNCGLEPMTEIIYYDSNDYSNIGITSTFDTQLLESDTIVSRQWTIIDWCVYDGVSDPVAISRDENCNGQDGETALYLIALPDGTIYFDQDSLPFNDTPSLSDNNCADVSGHYRSEIYSGGYYTYTQEIVVERNLRPTIISDLTQCVDTDCMKSMEFNFFVVQCIYAPEENSTPENVAFSIDLDADGIMDTTLVPVLNNLDQYSVNLTDLSTGEYSINIDITNQSNLQSTFEYTLKILACGLNTPPGCKDTYVDIIEHNGNSIASHLTPEELLEMPADDCGSLISYSINLAAEAPQPSQDFINFFCEDRGYQYPVEVWAYDKDGNSANCQTMVTILDPTSFCDSIIFEDEPQMIVSPLIDGDYAIGDTLEFAIQIKDMPSLLSMQFAVKWDSTHLSFADISYLNVAAFDGLADNAFGTPANTPYINSNQINVVWIDPGLSGIAFAEEISTMFHLRLVVGQCEATNVEIADLATFLPIEIVSSNYQMIEPVLTPGSLYSDCSPPITTAPFAQLSIPELQTNVGDTICLPVQADTFNKIFAFDFSINYPPDDLKFTEIRNLTDKLPYFDLNGSFGLPGQGVVEEGSINVLYWMGEENYTFSESTTLFDVCFEAQNQSNACNPVTFGGLSTQEAAFYSLFGDFIPSTLIDGMVKITQQVAYSICPHESMNINGTTYDQEHLSGTEIFDGSLCDSVVNIQLVYGNIDTSYLQAELGPGEIFEWNGQNYEQPGTFTQLYTNQSGCDSLIVLQLDMVNSTSETSKQPLSQSNAITPNNDGLNEFFVIEMLANQPGKYANNELIIFNRSGQIVYQAAPYENQWSGTNNKSQHLPAGTYYYLFRPDKTQNYVYKGDVTIIR
jgi:gliding motility-associated-like protein